MKHRHENVLPFPVYRDMPEELAALAVSGDKDEKPTIILNANEEAVATWRDLRLGVAIPAILGWGASEALRWIREHRSAIVATTAVTTFAYGGFDMELNGNGKPIAQPTITVIATPPAATQAPRPTATMTRTAPAIVITMPPDGDPITSAQPTPTSPQATTSPPATQTRTPAPAPTQTPTATAPGQVPTPAETTDTPPPTQPPDAETPPPTTSDPEPTITTAQTDCVLRVDVDPLLDLCVL